MVIDTLMALWNRDRRKKGTRVLIAFFLICISISLLFVIMSEPEQQQSRHRASDDAMATATIWQSTVGPSMTPTSTFVVVTQPTPTATPSQPCSVTPTSTIGHASTVQNRTIASQVYVLYLSPTSIPGAPVIAAPTERNNIASIPGMPGDGGPIATATPVPTATPGKQGGSGGASGLPTNCITNSLGDALDLRSVESVIHHLSFIISGSLLGTIAFYAAVYVGRRRRKIVRV